MGGVPPAAFRVVRAILLCLALSVSGRGRAAAAPDVRSFLLGNGKPEMAAGFRQALKGSEHFSALALFDFRADVPPAHGRLGAAPAGCLEGVSELLITENS